MAKDKLKLDEKEFATAVVSNYDPNEADDLKASNTI